MTDSKSIVSKFFKVQTRKVRCDESHWGQSVILTKPSNAETFYENIDKFRWVVLAVLASRDWNVIICKTRR